jgi:hypothetical protein
MIHVTSAANRTPSTVPLPASTPHFPPAQRSNQPLRSILFLVDVEPDARKTHPGAGEWEGSEKALVHLERLRGEFEQATGRPVQLNWFLRADPQIKATYGRANYVADACPGIMRAIQERGDYCGIHIHFWRWDSTRSEWFNDLNDAAWMAECVNTAIDAFRTMFGHSPGASRFGDRWLSETAVTLLRDAGVRYDLTAEPGLPGTPVHDDPHATSWITDYAAAPREPWMPSDEDLFVPRARTVSDAGRLWMIPLSTSRPGWRLVRRPPYVMKASRSPNLALDSSHVWPMIRAHLDRPSHVPLAFVVRSGDLATPRFMRNFLATTRELVRHPALAFSEFTDPATAMARWLETRNRLLEEGPGPKQAMRRNQ